MRVSLLLISRAGVFGLLLAWALPSASVHARVVTDLGEPHRTFEAGPVPTFHAADHNGDGAGDDTQDMTFRLTFTTPSTFETPGYVVFETGRFHVGTSLLLRGDRLVLLAGGDSSSPGGTGGVRVVSYPLTPGTRYEVVFCLLLDGDRDGTSDDTRGALYLDGRPAVDAAHPEAHGDGDIRVAGVADWSGSGPGGYGEATSGALYVDESGPARDFPGTDFRTTDGMLDGPLEFFADTFFDPDAASPPSRPNVLLITVDDMNWDSVGVFGSRLRDVTPNIDRFASEGMTFRRAHVSVAVCQPSRQSLLTGLYPHNNGGEGFEPIRPSVTTLIELLDRVSYRLGILSKASHVAPASEFPWDTRIDASALAQGRNPEDFYRETRTFMQQAIDESRPFFLMANSNDPHRPYHGSDQEAGRYSQAVRDTFAVPSRVYASDEVPVPGFLPDLPDIRREIAQYYSSCRRADDSVGRILDALDDVGARDNTIVVFLSDNGIAVPFAKTNVWFHSTRTPLIVRWPGVVTPGAVDVTHFIVGTDLMPTLLEAIGVEHSLSLDGSSFLPLLRGETQPGRDRSVTVFHETAAGRRYEMRALQGTRHGYIFNAWSDGRTVFRNESQNGLTWTAMTLAGRSSPAIQARVDHFSFRQPEEFYDYSTDSDALNNLASQPEHAVDIVEARNELLAWMARTRDPLLDVFVAYVRANPLAPEQSFRRGDCNADGRVEGQVSDALFMLGHLFTGGPEPACVAACDVNADGAVEVTDVVYALLFNFLGGPAPAPPFPDCGPLLADETLGCETSTEACRSAK